MRFLFVTFFCLFVFAVHDIVWPQSSFATVDFVILPRLDLEPPNLYFVAPSTAETELEGGIDFAYGNRSPLEYGLWVRSIFKRKLALTVGSQMFGKGDWHWATTPLGETTTAMVFDLWLSGAWFIPVYGSPSDDTFQMGVLPVLQFFYGAGLETYGVYPIFGINHAWHLQFGWQDYFSTDLFAGSQFAAEENFEALFLGASLQTGYKYVYGYWQPRLYLDLSGSGRWRVRHQFGVLFRYALD